MKKVILSLLLLCNLAMFSGGGYLGKIHNFGVSSSLNPIALITKQTYGTHYWDITLGPNLTLRPFYEIAVSKGVSITSDVGFHNFKLGGSTRESSFYTESTQKSYISGFDLKTSIRFYGYKKNGKIAPVGKYGGFMIRIPFLKQYVSPDLSKSKPMLFLGLEKGIQKVISKHLSLDYGFNCSVSTQLINRIKIFNSNYSFYEANIIEIENDWTEAEDLSLGFYNNIQNSFNIYLKIGFLR
jgi:hypothetical protein